MTDKYAVIGNPIEHSKSPLIHAAFALQTGQDLIYERILAPLDSFADTATEFRGQGGRGLSVTVPFKEDAFLYATQLTKRAELAQAVNTLHFRDSGEVFGDTTDGVGLVGDITRNLAIPLVGKRVLLLGAGGAARGVIQPLLDEHPQLLMVVNRTLGKATALKTNFSRIEVGGYADLAGNRFDVIINATSSSLSNELPPLPDHIFSVGALAYDMMYGRETPFMTFARAQGVAIVEDGLGMLVEQAAEAFYLWRGVRPDTASVIASMRKA